MVRRVVLPGTATVVVIAALDMILVEWALDRSEAMLAVVPMLPSVHPDILDHWLDSAFARPGEPFTARKIASWVALGLIGFTLTTGTPTQPIIRPYRVIAMHSIR